VLLLLFLRRIVHAITRAVVSSIRSVSTFLLSTRGAIVGNNSKQEAP